MVPKPGSAPESLCYQSPSRPAVQTGIEDGDIDIDIFSFIPALKERAYVSSTDVSAYRELLCAHTVVLH